jgi:hypothetical protein
MVQTVGETKARHGHQMRFIKQYGVERGHDARHDGRTFTLASIGNLVKTVVEQQLSTAEELVGLLQLIPTSVPSCVPIALRLGAGSLTGGTSQAVQLCKDLDGGPLLSQVFQSALTVQAHSARLLQMFMY